MTHGDSPTKRNYMISPRADRLIREIRKSGAITEKDVRALFSGSGKHRPHERA